MLSFSGHRTDSMLKRYHVINVDDLRRAAERGSAYTGRAGQVVPLRGDQHENPESGHRKLISRLRTMSCRVTESSGRSRHLPHLHLPVGP
jgi:hypothetical protein